MNDNQNFRVQQAGRPSSRVLAPSGGHSGLSFGLAPISQTREVRTAASKDNEVSQLENKVTTAPTQPAVVGPAGTVLKQSADQPISANAFASGSNINGAQVMTGRPTSRVLAPPGGHTSIRLG